MDNITAALIGTGVGALTTVAAALVGPSIAARKTTRREHRKDVRDEIANVLLAFMSLLAARRTGSNDQLRVHAEALTAVTRLSVLLGPRELDVEKALDYALDLLSNAKLAAAAAAIEALRVVLHSWYRGEVRGKKIGDLYGEELDVALRRATGSDSPRR
ncbi:hypothetical protein I6E81_06420 [Salinibacterium sp. NG22]|uniref:hypothetical protein n=1 Tax=Salinibacterium sp. NG22 TaxID=2792040 RepID=UPI0018CF7459|nr:hypothetical protein [Salinibacterium sp. NG22]MBH0109797.1 hypothetical protein [Salinibacterium sp. NG22]